tara:strand:- start:24 stop:500 length:477 start_codon:yes stop_codon:yes gene_type:complete
MVQYGCASVEVAKEVTKASKSIKTTVENITKKNNDEDIKITDKEDSEKFLIEKEKEIVKVEQKKEKKLVKEQKKITKINFIGKNLDELNSLLGKENLFRIDGNTTLVRFDEKTCRLFLFFNSNKLNAKVEHFEIRDQTGNLVKTKEKIQVCYDNFNLS